ncbi:HAMP domain-containing sensor histidine kinase [Streptomyces sp. A5-4]|uniref:HAMP domain-containing sensor histidine kinase n=1 Tax=Streptomyces sp. A5-4 TaxID=3384771 RepID=UPI003DA8DA5D
MSRRLRSAAGTARRIAAGELDARISAAPRPHDEIAEISMAVDTMAAALQERLRGEQRFTADVAHELRTPLMGLVTSAELLPDGEAAGYVRDRVRVLSALVEELLEISRLDAGAEQADLSPCALGPLLEEIVIRIGLPVRLRVEDAEGPVSAAGGVDAVGAVGAVSGVDAVGALDDVDEPAAYGSKKAVTVWTDPRRLERIITNLIVNTHRNGKAPVTVTVLGGTAGADRVVTVRDHGPGYPDTLLKDGPKRFRTGARERGTGHGLGLTIALGQAAVLGTELVFTNAPDGGALATLRLPGGPSCPEAEPIHR